MQAKFLDLNEIQEYLKKRKLGKIIESSFENNPVKNLKSDFCRELSIFLKNSVNSVIPLQI